MLLQADAIAVERGEDLILQGLSFDLSAGEMLVLEGENGSGKSTLLRAIAGLLPLSAGTLMLSNKGEFEEQNLSDLCHYLGHDNAMKTNLALGENLDFWRNMAFEPHLETEEALEMVGLVGLESIPFAHLSTGQRRRAAIARLLVSYRPIWLLDEPTAGLDAQSSEQFAALLGAHLEDHGLVIAATHVPLGVPNTKHLRLGVPSS